MTNQDPTPAAVSATLRSPGAASAELAQINLTDIGARIAPASARLFVVPGSAAEAWTAAFSRALPAGACVLVLDQGEGAGLAAEAAEARGLSVERAASGDDLARRLGHDTADRIRAVVVVEEPGRARARRARRALDAAFHDALLFVDCADALASVAEDAVADLTLLCGRRTPLLPDGLAVVAAGPRALTLSAPRPPGAAAVPPPRPAAVAAE